ncbi:MAG: RNA polymerase sigma factor [Opitutales bacterium]|nr:RNA polymerase sigma factor [Opitutales bacterium]MCH8541598.1 RNA polymerase sigma factor [Opitutales bacterium]
MIQTNDDDDEIQWIHAAQSGDESAFRSLFDRYYEVVYRVLYRLAGNQQDAEDLVQEAFVKAARRLPGFRGEASFKNWLCRIAVNAARDWFRKCQRRPATADAREDQPSSLEQLAAPRRNATHDLLHDSLGQLKEKERQALVLTYFEGFNHAEAAEVLRCAESTVSWHIHQAKQKLKEILSHHV